MRNLIRTILEALREWAVGPRIQAAVSTVPGIPASKVLLSIPRDPGSFDSSDWYQEFKRKNEAAMAAGEDAQTAALCPYPGCEGHMLSGPEAGMSVNIKCDTCERKWNLTSMIERMERI